jgi:uncharacterized SAM-binding protein YcdF (DUF218 family)
VSQRTRLVVGAVGVVATVLVGYYVITVYQVWRASRHDGAQPSEAIIVLGAAQYNGKPSPVFKARLDHAADLYNDGIAPTIVVTGGKIPGDRFTEAGAGADYLHTLGIPDDAILRETTSRNSWESLRASARFLKARGATRVVLVSDPFHSLRIRLIAEENGLDATTSPTHTSPIHGLAAWRRILGEGVRVAAGRIFGFGRLDRATRKGALGIRAASTEVGWDRRARLTILAGPSGVV